METLEKVWLIISGILIFCGLMAFVIVMSVNGWDFTKLSTIKMQTKEYAFLQNFEGISIDTKTNDVTFVKTEESEAKVVCYEETNMAHEVTVQDGALTIKVVNTKKWYQYIGISFHTPTLTVYLPESQYGALQIKNSTGTVEIPQDFCFESVDVTVSTGSVNIFAQTTGQTKIKTTTGSVCVKNTSVGALDISVSTGKVTVENVDVLGQVNIGVSTGDTYVNTLSCQTFVSRGSTGDISLTSVMVAQSLDINRSTGNVKFTLCDAGDIKVKTDTGSVKGSFISDKVFHAKSDTGRINIPSTTQGGSCFIETDTGNIFIEIKQE